MAHKQADDLPDDDMELSALDKQIAALQKQRDKKALTARQQVMTPEVKFLLNAIAQGFFKLDKDGILQGSDHHSSRDREDKPYGEQLQELLENAGIKVQSDKEGQHHEAETIDNTLSPDCGWDSDHYTHIPAYEETTHYLTIDPAQPKFAKNLEKAVLSSRVENVMEKMKAQGLEMDDDVMAALEKSERKKLQQELNSTGEGQAPRGRKRR